jgi:outer membrane protein, heavy metal efflux system
MHTVWGIAFLALTTTRVFSQGIALDSLIRMALRGNPDLDVAREEYSAAATDTLATRLAVNPVLGLEAGYNLTAPARPKASVKISREFQAGVRRNGYQSAQAGLAAQGQKQMAQAAELTAAIRSDFFTWQIWGRKLSLQSEVEKRWNALSALAAAKVKEGRISQVDEAQARLNAAKARQKEMEIQSEIESLRHRIGYMTGADLLRDSLVVVPLDSLPPLAGLDSLEAWAAGENPGLRILDKECDAQKRQLEWEQSLGNPAVTLSLGLEREPDGDNLVGAGVELPLPFSQRNQAGLEKSRLSLRAAYSRRKAAGMRLEQEVAEIHGQLEILAQRYAAYRKEIRNLSRKQLELCEQGFLQGALGIFELSRVQEEYLARESEALDIQQAFYDQWNRLGKAVGGKSW